jgi:hypothetical protein
MIGVIVMSPSVMVFDSGVEVVVGEGCVVFAGAAVWFCVVCGAQARIDEAAMSANASLATKARLDCSEFLSVVLPASLFSNASIFSSSGV